MLRQTSVKKLPISLGAKEVITTKKLRGRIVKGNIKKFIFLFVAYFTETKLIIFSLKKNFFLFVTFLDVYTYKYM